MQITTVSYGLTVNLGNYESARLDATATIGPNETPDEALDKLRSWVNGQASKERRPKPTESKDRS